MYKKVMVPLDGSQLVECVLLHVEAIAKGCQVQNVVFVRAVEPFYVPPSSDYSFSEEQKAQINEEHGKEAKDYLNNLVSQTKYGGVNVQSEVITGRAAEKLADYATKNGVDLIIIATHGRSGITRWVWGSVADRILRSSCVPILMVLAPGCKPGS